MQYDILPGTIFTNIYHYIIIIVANIPFHRNIYIKYVMFVLSNLQHIKYVMFFLLINFQQRTERCQLYHIICVSNDITIIPHYMCQMTLQLYHIICVKWHYNYTTLYVSNDITIKYSFRLHCQSSRYFEMHEVFTPYILKWRVQFVFCYFVVLLSIECL